MLQTLLPYIDGIDQALSFDELLGITKIAPRELFELLQFTKCININGINKYYIPKHDEDLVEASKVLRINTGAIRRNAVNRKLSAYLAEENAHLKTAMGLKPPSQRVVLNAGEFLILLLSDWHVEERVTYDCTGGQNEVTPQVIEARVQVLCDRLADELEKYRGMPLVVWLGGDFINGSIHQEYNEIGGNFLVPEEAKRFAIRLLAKVLNTVKRICAVRVICNYGNHGRVNQGTPRSQSGALYNHEYFMYLYLRDLFGDLDFQVTPSYCAYLELGDDCSVRFTHGDSVGRDQVANWIRKQDVIYTRETKRVCLLTCMGHYHTMQLGNGYLINSALVGGNLYSRSKGYEPEPPQQTLALFSGQEIVWVKRLYCASWN